MSALLPASPDGHPELAVAWVLHALEPDEDAEFAEHLADCAGCRRIVEETEEVATLLGSAVEPSEPPPALRTRILAAAEADLVSSPHPDASEALSACSPDLLAPSGRKAPSSPAAARRPRRHRRPHAPPSPR